MTQSSDNNLLDYLKSRDFRYTLMSVVVALCIFLLVAFLWLRLYTHHGQELKMPDYTGMTYEDAVKDAHRKKFRISIQDSLHVLGKPGGEVLKQNPPPGSTVKQNRMIYVTITKRSPDKILSGRLPEMYGKSFDRKKKELEDHFEIQSKIVDTRYDPGDPGQVLEVHYKGETIMDAKGRNNTVSIEKGDYLEFVISSKTGGKVDMPDLSCKTYEEARFLLENVGLKVGEVISDDNIATPENGFIATQSPSAGEVIEMDTPVNLTITSEKPEHCQ